MASSPNCVVQFGELCLMPRTLFGTERQCRKAARMAAEVGFGEMLCVELSPQKSARAL